MIKSTLISVKHFRYSVSIILLVVIYQFNSFAQDITYAHKVVNTLASQEMKGRGYVQNGNGLAANYICDEFKKMGLLAYSKNYLQAFTTPVNTFPGSMSVKINDIELKPGIDYLIDAESPSIEGTFKIVYIKAEELLKKDLIVSKIKTAKDKLIVIEAYDKNQYSKDENKKITDAIFFLKTFPDNPIAGIILLTKSKLVWDVSAIRYSKPCLIVKVDNLFPAIEKITVNIKSKYIKKFKVQNIIAYVEGKRKDSLIVLTAHYDHLGMMGKKTIFPGANDNASGVAMLLNLAKYYSKNKPEYTTVFIAFAGEEIGLIGSEYFVNHPMFKLQAIKFLINFDLAGTGDEGIQVVNGSIFKNEYEKLLKINEEQHFLPQVKIRGEACNSDHCPFYKKDVHCFFIYTLGGINAYHDIYDKAETLPFTKFDEYFKLMLAFIKDL